MLCRYIWGNCVEKSETLRKSNISLSDLDLLPRCVCQKHNAAYCAALIYLTKIYNLAGQIIMSI